MVRTLADPEIWDLVETGSFGHLGCHADGETYVVPISYARDGDRLVGMTSAGRKIEMMRRNPNVCVQVDEVRSLTQWRSAILWGTFEELSGNERNEAVGRLIDKYGLEIDDTEWGFRGGRDVTPPRVDKRPEPMIAYAIRVHKLSGRAEGDK